MFISSPWLRGVIAGLAGAVAWFVGLQLFFGPAQTILTDSRLQSAKFLAAFTTEPAPRMNTAPWVLAVGLVIIAMLWGCV